MLLGSIINGEEAFKLGMVDYLANSSANLDEIINEVKIQVLNCSPNAISVTKVLSLNEKIDERIAAELFSDCIVSDEGQRDLILFLKNVFLLGFQSKIR